MVTAFETDRSLGPRSRNLPIVAGRDDRILRSSLPWECSVASARLALTTAARRQRVGQFNLLTIIRSSKGFARASKNALENFFLNTMKAKKCGEEFRCGEMFSLTNYSVVGK
jgi:hypothetical protein